MKCVQDLVSIIIPMYNCGNYVVDCLKQVSNQDYENIEIICVVEQSDDNTLELVNTCAKDDDRIVAIKQKHLGAGVARTNGISHSKGKYLCFFDVDDSFSNQYVSKMYDAITKNDSDIVICNETSSNKELFVGRIKKYFNDSIFHNKTYNPTRINDLFITTSSMAHNKMFLRNLIISNNLSFSDSYCLNDVKFVYSALVCANKITFIKNALYCYRNVYDPNRITSNRKMHKDDLITVFNDLYVWLDNNNFYNTYKKTFVKTWQNVLYSFCRYDNDEQFVKQICDYLCNYKPWSDMNDEELYRNCKLDLSLTKLKLLLLKVKKHIHNDTNKNLDYRIKVYTNMIINIKRIREKLKNEYDKKYVIKDNLIASIIRRFTDSKENG